MAHRYEVAPATPEEVGRFCMQNGDHTVLRVDGTAVAYACVAKDAGGRTWAGLTVADGARDHGLRVVRELRRFLDRRNETTYVVCGFPEFAKAGRLLTILGFCPTDETVANDKKVWRWRAMEWR